MTLMVKHTGRIALAVFMVCVMILLLASCASDKNNGETEDQPKTNANDQYRDNEMMYWNRLSSVGTPPFALPDASQDSDDSFDYSYMDVTQEDYDSFLSGLTAEGFASVRMKYSDFLFRDDCMVFSVYDEGTLSLSWYQKSLDAPQGGISNDEAADLLMPDRSHSLSSVALHPIDITPEGVYERTGGQLFAVPNYSFDSFNSSGDVGLMIDSNESYSCTVYYVTGTESYVVSMERIAVCDIDDDGSDDVLFLSYGPTSGLFTFMVTCVASHGVYDTIFQTESCYLTFFCKDGKLVIDGVGYDSVHHFFDVVLEENDGDKTIMLYDDGQQLQAWGHLYQSSDD